MGYFFNDETDRLLRDREELGRTIYVDHDDDGRY